MKELLKELSIENYRGFFSKQTIHFAVPDRENDGSGLTVIVGQNNSGKSTIMDVLKKFKPGVEFQKSDRHGKEAIRWELVTSLDQKKTLKTEGGTKGFVDHPEMKPTEKEIYIIPSRRSWNAFFPKASMTKVDYRNAIHRMTSVDIDSEFGKKMVEIADEPSLKKRFNALMKKAYPYFFDWEIEIDRNQKYINYSSNGGAEHNSDLFGDGISSLFRICAVLLESSEEEIIIVDEPELSLHPQAQKRIAKLLSEYSRRIQIVVITHSPYFVNWADLKNGAIVNRLSKRDDVECVAKHLNHKASYYETLFKFSESWQQPQLMDIVAKELFFSEAVLFVEGQEDVGLITKFCRDNNIDMEFDVFGYGVGGAGNIIHLLSMADDLGIKSGALYDGDKKSDYEAIVAKYKGKVKIEILKKDDIRDKMKKNPEDGKDSKEVLKEGIFDNSGNIKEDWSDYLKKLIEEFNTYFTPSSNTHLA